MTCGQAPSIVQEMRRVEGMWMLLLLLPPRSFACVHQKCDGCLFGFGLGVALGFRIRGDVAYNPRFDERLVDCSSARTGLCLFCMVQLLA